jgi:cbb3-type cytochrome oxidase subunit 1
MGRRMRAQAIGVVGLLIGLIANLLVTAPALSLLSEPVGARVRPMGEAAALFQAALLGAFGSVISFVAVRRQGTRWSGVAGLILGLTPLPLGVVLLRYVIQLRHLVDLP